MKALILNSGMGTRMAPLTDRQPKCLTELSPGETILGRQLRQLAEAGIQDVTVTTGPFPGVLEEYCEGLNLPLRIRFVISIQSIWPARFWRGSCSSSTGIWCLKTRFSSR